MKQLPDELHRAFEDAFNRHDLESVVGLYEPQAVLVTSVGPVRGMERIREIYRHVFTFRPTIDVQTVSVTRAGDLAMLHGRWTMQGLGPDGGPIHRDGRNTETARQQPDGRWLFVIDDPLVPQA